MKLLSCIALTAAAVLLQSCYVDVNKPDDEDTTLSKPFSFQTSHLFPFNNTTNWWKYTESGGNHITVAVTDTISDDNTMYYRVIFQEANVDTTTDWFKREAGNVLFGPSLVGTYDVFLPARFETKSGSFTVANKTVNFSFYDSVAISGTIYHNVLSLYYYTPVIHGFEEIVLADSIGIVQLKDNDGRWPVVYSIDSCSVSGIKTVF